MNKRRLLWVAMLLLVAVALPLAAESDLVKWQNRLKEYFNGVAMEVKGLEDAAEKRDVLNRALDRLFGALDQMERLPGLTDRQKEAIALFRAEVQEKHDELGGLDGFQAVANADLDAFADYMVQDLEQAQSYFVISGLGLLLIILILIILL